MTSSSVSASDGGYERLRSAILDRDEALAGSINPMLAAISAQSRKLDSTAAAMWAPIGCARSVLAPSLIARVCE